VTGVLGITRDISERSRAEAALRQSENELRAMFQVASVGLAQADPRTGRWLRVNEKMCAITGYTAEELLGLRIPEITYQEDRHGDWELFERVVKGEAADYRLEKRYVRKDGSVVWVNVNMTVVRDGDGSPIRTVAAIEDITARKRAEAKIAEQLDELRRWHQATMGREDRILELKGEVNKLLADAGKPPRYPSALGGK
jgi:PAS domain S-box-containing protein